MCVVIRVRKRKNFYVARNSFEKYRNIVVWMTGRAAEKTHGRNVLFTHESCSI